MKEETFLGMMADEVRLLKEAEAESAQLAARSWKIAPEDVDALTKQKIASLGISEAFLSGESCSEPLSDFLNKEWSTQQSFFETRQLAEARENMQNRLKVNLQNLHDNIMMYMRIKSLVSTGRTGVIVTVFYPETTHHAFRSLRYAKVWNKNRIRAIKEQK